MRRFGSFLLCGEEHPVASASLPVLESATPRKLLIEGSSIGKKVLKYLPTALCRTADTYADLIWFTAQVDFVS